MHNPLGTQATANSAREGAFGGPMAPYIWDFSVWAGEYDSTTDPKFSF